MRPAAASRANWMPAFAGMTHDSSVLLPCVPAIIELAAAVTLHYVVITWVNVTEKERPT